MHDLDELPGKDNEDKIWFLIDRVENIGSCTGTIRGVTISAFPGQQFPEVWKQFREQRVLPVAA